MNRIIRHLMKRKLFLRLSSHYSNEHDLTTHNHDEILFLANGGARSIDRLTTLEKRYRTNDILSIIEREHHHQRSRRIKSKLMGMARRLFGTTENDPHGATRRKRKTRYEYNK